MRKYFVIALILIFIIGCAHNATKKTTEMQNQPVNASSEDSIDTDLNEQEALLDQDLNGEDLDKELNGK